MAAPDVVRLLSRCPSLTVLCTSRGALKAYGESIYPVNPLAVAKEEESGACGEAAPTDAARLFADRVGMVQRGFHVTADNHDGIEEICRRVDGLPLALELAAARLRSLPLGVVLDGLAKSYHLLAEGASDGDVRHASLQATIDWSYGLLDGSERALFRRFSVFHGGFTPEAAAAVARPDAAPEDVLAGILSLVDKCLIERSDAEDLRFHMLETIREYARERLRDLTDAEEVCQRHAAYVAAWLAGLHDCNSPLTWHEFRNAMGREQPNIEAAMNFAQESGNYTLAFEILTMQVLYQCQMLTSSIWPSWAAMLDRIPDDVCEPLRTRVLLAANVAWGRPRFAVAGAEIERLLETGLERILKAEAPRLRLWLLMSAGSDLAMEGDDPDMARRYAELYLRAAMEVAGENNPSLFIGAVLRGQAQTSILRGYGVAVARDLAERAYEIDSSRGDAIGVAYTLHWLGHRNVAEGRYVEGIGQLEEAAATYAELGLDRTWSEAQLLILVASVCLGRHAEVDRTMGRILANRRIRPYVALVSRAADWLARSAAARGLTREAGLVVGAKEAFHHDGEIPGVHSLAPAEPYLVERHGTVSTWPSDYADDAYNVFVRAMRSIGGEETYAQLRAEGARMTLDEAAALVFGKGYDKEIAAC